MEMKSVDLKPAKNRNMGEFFLEENPMKPMKSDLELARQSIICKAMSRKNKLRRKEFYNEYIKKQNLNYQHFW